MLTDGAFNDLEKDKIGGKEQITQKLAQFKKEMDAKDIITSNFNYDGRGFRTARKGTTKYV